MNYVSLYNVVKTEMEQKSHLLEHLSQRILRALSNQFPVITGIDLIVSKLNPPVGGKMKQVSFTTKWNKI